MVSAAGSVSPGKVPAVATWGCGEFHGHLRLRRASWPPLPIRNSEEPK